MKSSSGASTFALAAGLIVFNFAATVLVFLVAMPLLIPAGNVSPAGYAAIQRGTAILVFAAGTVFSFLLAFAVRRLARRGVSPAAMIDAVRQPCFILNPDNTYSLINREAGRLLGLSHERDAGKPVDPGVQAALAAGAAAGDAEAGRGMNRNCVVTLGGARYLALDNPFSATDSDSAGQRQGRLVVLRNVEAELRIRDCFKEIVAAMVVLGDDTRNIVESSTRLTQSAMSQDSSIAAITSSLDEFSKKIQGNTESAAKGTQFAAQAREVAERSGGEIAHALSAMNEVQDVGVRIARIVKLIDDIAFQTNLLALNASVEAARAGRQGKGFAVVAEEVRNLAGRSARAAKDTASMVEDVTERIGNASSYMSRLEEMLRNIVQEAVRMADYSASAAATSTEQASAILQVNQELGQINSMTRSTCSAAEDTSSHVGNLENKVGELRHLLERFAIDMGGVVRPGPQSHFPSRKSGGSALHDDFAAGRYAPSFAPPFTPPSFGASPADDDFVEPFKKMAAEKWNLRADAGNGSPLPDLLRTDGYDREYNAFLRTGAPESTASHTPLSHFVKQTGENGSGGGNAYSNLADGPAEYKTNRDGDKIVRPEQKIHLDDAEFGRY